MKTVLPLLLVSIALVGCGGGSNAPASNPANDALIQKLNSMPASQRAEYTKTHMDEVMKAAATSQGSK